jgi:hypothetical protein
VRLGEQPLEPLAVAPAAPKVVDRGCPRVVPAAIRGHLSPAISFA